MALQTHLLAERAVPRYTSYPTAPHFGPQVTAATYADWLDRLAADARLSLYLHVPFCRELCLYCGCHTKAVRQQAPVERYAAELEREVALLAARLRGQAVSHIHWGGGTPSIVGGERLKTLAEALARAFSLQHVREHAIELDPRHVDRDLVRALAAIGVNRVSLGAQDFSPHVQAAIGRIQPFEMVKRAADLVREAGIERINLDLMYGLPKQRLQDVRLTAERAIDLAPQRIALFGYAHVPWFKPQQRLFDPADLPGAAERLRQSEAARAAFLTAGYRPIGLDHFALASDELALAAEAGRLRRNFQGYTADDADALLGLGASAIGRLPQGYVQNAPDLGGYARALAAGRFAIVRGIELGSEDRMRADIIERIMCDLRVDLRIIVPPPNGPEFTAEIESLRPLVADGLVEIDGAVVTVTERGRPFVRLVAAAFDAHLAASPRAHSRAV
jgi:oxygen-independent coproporphyrinogen-3 oxidase